LQRLPDERPPLSGMHPPECWLLVESLHRGQSDEQGLARDCRPGDGFEVLLLAAAFHLVQFIPKPSGRDDTEPDTLVRVWV